MLQVPAAVRAAFQHQLQAARLQLSLPQAAQPRAASQTQPRPHQQQAEPGLSKRAREHAAAASKAQMYCTQQQQVGRQLGLGKRAREQAGTAEQAQLPPQKRARPSDTYLLPPLLRARHPTHGPWSRGEPESLAVMSPAVADRRCAVLLHTTAAIMHAHHKVQRGVDDVQMQALGADT